MFYWLQLDRFATDTHKAEGAHACHYLGSLPALFKKHGMFSSLLLSDDVLQNLSTVHCSVNTFNWSTSIVSTLHSYIYGDGRFLDRISSIISYSQAVCVTKRPTSNFIKISSNNFIWNSSSIVGISVAWANSSILRSFAVGMQLCSVGRHHFHSTNFMCLFFNRLCIWMTTVTTAFLYSPCDGPGDLHMALYSATDGSPDVASSDFKLCSRLILHSILFDSVCGQS